jgi:hypothetical protein
LKVRAETAEKRTSYAHDVLFKLTSKSGGEARGTCSRMAAHKKAAGADHDARRQHEPQSIA